MVAFEIYDTKNAVAKVYLTTTGEIVYGGPRRDRNISESWGNSQGGQSSDL